ncbi:hypothetical protein [Lachnoclostridium phytofermentans]|uniref:Uncharacterized protein n=1 Tax=Lachnoclostridium phytofermentans (strain ATCC 700394 / DSM 18823 / ISDg) TaxID=357809 RepID=A9KI60_LACP7|nr:hypothetical protein [Lachnoclostridium phytofermentans]ABX40894.1 hypothetical protein Cphy_0507 [Lachnoclostridium phytofermentans ISDg]
MFDMERYEIMFDTERYEIMFNAEKSVDFDLDIVVNSWAAAAKAVQAKTGIFVNAQFVEKMIAYHESNLSERVVAATATRNPTVITDKELFFDALIEVINNTKLILGNPYTSLTRLPAEVIVM